MPVLVRVTVCVLLLPTFTFPKLMLDGLGLSRKVRPKPESETWAGELLALLTTEMLPVAVPPAVGAKTALKLVLCLGLRVSGSASLRMLKPGPVTFA